MKNLTKKEIREAFTIDSSLRRDSRISLKNKEAKMTNMTKKEIRKAKTIDLALRMDALLSRTEGEEGVLLADLEECREIDDELKRRLHKALGRSARDIGVLTQYVSYVPDDAQPKDKKAVTIRFNVTVLSIVGGTVCTFSVDADTKAEADLKIRKELRERKLGGFNYRIS